MTNFPSRCKIKCNKATLFDSKVTSIIHSTFQFTQLPLRQLNRKQNSSNRGQCSCVSGVWCSVLSAETLDPGTHVWNTVIISDLSEYSVYYW